MYLEAKSQRSLRQAICVSTFDRWPAAQAAPHSRSPSPRCSNRAGTLILLRSGPRRRSQRPASRSPRLTRTNSCSATKSWQRGLSRSLGVAQGQVCRHGRVHVAAKDEADAANRGGRADVGDEQLYRPLRACAAGGDAAGRSRSTGASKEGPRSDGRADGPHGIATARIALPANQAFPRRGPSGRIRLPPAG